MFGRSSIGFAITASLALSASIGCGGRAGGTAGPEASGPADLEHCTNLDDEQTQPVKLQLENHTTNALYVGPLAQTCYGSSASEPFAVVDDAGYAVSSERQCGNVSCGQLAQGSPGFGCSNVCLDRAFFTWLQPGESLSTSWLPERLVPYELPPKCLKNSAFELASCTRAERVLLGTTLTFSTQGSRELDCSSLPGGCGDCQASPLGGCGVQAKRLTGTVLQASSTIELDEDYVTAGSASKIVTLELNE